MMCLLSFVCCLLFFKQKTAYEMRISDWSSDVCSSDLGVEDLPLMPGLAEIADAATVFDAPQGRIVESYAAGTVAAAEIRSFYAQTLPQLGWTAVDAGQAGPLEFRREGERLTLEITPGQTTSGAKATTEIGRAYI